MKYLLPSLDSPVFLLLFSFAIVISKIYPVKIRLLQLCNIIFKNSGSSNSLFNTKS